MKTALAELDALTLTGYRFALGAIAILPFIALKSRSRMAFRSASIWKSGILLGIALSASYLLLSFGLRTGINRGKFGVSAPSISGNKSWERINRVHINTLEQLIVFIPAILAFSYYVSSLWACVLGGAFIVARQIYSMSYIKNASKRIFPPTFFIVVALTVGSIIGIIMSLFKAQA